MSPGAGLHCKQHSSAPLAPAARSQQNKIRTQQWRQQRAWSDKAGILTEEPGHPEGIEKGLGEYGAPLSLPLSTPGLLSRSVKGCRYRRGSCSRLPP